MAPLAGMVSPSTGRKQGESWESRKRISIGIAALEAASEELRGKLELAELAVKDAAALWEELYMFVKGRRSVILGVWAAPGASGAISLGAGASPPPF